MVLGKRVAIFDWEWGRNSAPREGQKIPWTMSHKKDYALYIGQDFLKIRLDPAKGGNLLGDCLSSCSLISNTFCQLSSPIFPYSLVR